MAQPLVTIGAINYNNAKYVIDTLNSIGQQTYADVELIIVDDCSTDNSVELIKKWLANYDKPFRFIEHEKNNGICATCNDVLNYAKGKYISIIATDDIMLPDKTRIQVEILEKSEPDVCGVYSDSYLIKEDGTQRYGLFIQRFRDFEDAPSGRIFEKLLEDNFIPDFTMLVKAACYKDVGNYDEMLVYEDYDMLLRLARKYKIVFSGYVATKYRIRKNSLSGTIKNWYASQLKIFAKHVDFSKTAIRSMEMAAKNAYTKNDTEALNALPQYAYLSPYIAMVSRLWKIRVPKKIGKAILRLKHKNL